MSVDLIDFDKLSIKLDDIQNIDLSAAMDDCGYLVENQAVKNIHKGGITDTGQLAQSIEHEVAADGLSVEIGTSNSYAWYVHEGTGIHAKNGGRLTSWRYFYTGNKLGPNEVKEEYHGIMGVWRTTHGQKPKPFLTDALHQQENRIERIIKNAVKGALAND